MNRKEPKKKRIEEIITAAVSVFLEKGYEGASMDMIAQKAGLSKGGLYHHFSSKDEILLAANEVYFYPVLVLMKKTQAKDDPVEGLKYYILSYLKHWKNHKREMIFSFLSLAKMIADKSMWKSMTNYTEEMVSFYENLLKKGIESGKLKTHDTRARAFLLFTSLDGIIGYLVMDQYLSVTNVADYFTEVFLKDIIVNKK